MEQIIRRSWVTPPARVSANFDALPGRTVANGQLCRKWSHRLGDEQDERNLCVIELVLPRQRGDWTKRFPRAVDAPNDTADRFTFAQLRTGTRRSRAL